MKTIIYAAATAMAWGILAAPAMATCGVGGYWGSECGPQTPVTGGDTTNTATGGASSSDATAGANSGATADAIIGDVTGGGAEIGDITAIGGDGGQGGAGGSSTSGVIGSGNSDSRSSVTGSGNSNSRSQTTTTVDASSRTTYREAANTVIAPPLVGNGPQNCFGDTNPGGSTTGGIGTRALQATIGHVKPMNPCGVVWAEERAYAGRPVLMHYYSANDPAANRAFKQAGMTGRPGDAARRQAVFDSGPGYTICTPEKIRVVPGRENEGLANCQEALSADRRAPKNTPRAVKPTPAVQAYAQVSAYRSCYLVGNVAEVEPKTPDAKSACAAKFPRAFKVR